MFPAWLNLLLARKSPENLGARGERLAARYLKRRGYRLLHRNFKLGDDEADIIAIDPDQRTMRMSCSRRSQL